jgi:hypothetical protein
MFIKGGRMGIRRILTVSLLMVLLGAGSSVSGSPADTGRAGEAMRGIPMIGQAQNSADIATITARMRSLGFEIGKITAEGGNYLVPVTGVRGRTRALRQRGLFKPFTVLVRVEEGQIVLDKGDLEGAGLSVADAQALLAMGVRVEQVKAQPGGSQAGKPARASRPTGTAATRASRVPAQKAAGPLKKEAIRWSPMAMAPSRPGLAHQPPALGKAVGIQKAEKQIEFKSSLFRVNKRPPLAFKRIPLLDPSKEVPTPIGNPAQLLPVLLNGQELNAEEYFNELNSLEQGFNSLGYSLDIRRDPSKKILLQEIPPPGGQNGVRAEMDVAALAAVSSKPGDFASAVTAKRDRLAALLGGKKMAPAKVAPKPVREGQTAQQKTGAVLQKTAPMSIEEALAERKKALKPIEIPFKKELNPTIIEKGDRDTFAIALTAGSRMDGNVQTINVVNSVGVIAYLFGHGLNLLTLQGTTFAPAGGGQMLAEMAVMVLGDNVVGAALRETGAVPAGSLAEAAQAPSVGGASNWSATLDESYGMSFMAGPVPLSVRVGARATVGLDYTLWANPVKVENEITPYANADVYAQGGVTLLIVEAGVECKLNLLDTRLTVHGVLDRGAENGKEFLDTDYFIYEYYSALSGAFSLYARVCVPRWGLPPWEWKEYESKIAGWDGYSDEVWAQREVRRKHYLYNYPGTPAAVLAGYDY